MKKRLELNDINIAELKRLIKLFETTSQDYSWYKDQGPFSPEKFSKLKNNKIHAEHGLVMFLNKRMKLIDK